MRDRFHWTHLLAFVTGPVNQELLLRNEYLAVENRIFKAHLPSRFWLSDPERSTLAEIAKRLGHKALKDVACVAMPDTILAWYRRLVAPKFDGSLSLGVNRRDKEVGCRQLSGDCSSVRRWLQELFIQLDELRPAAAQRALPRVSQ